MEIESTSEAGLVIGALEDNDDTDKKRTGICEWVLSFKINSKCIVILN